jgi:hypothetical protein
MLYHFEIEFPMCDEYKQTSGSHILKNVKYRDDLSFTTPSIFFEGVAAGFYSLYTYKANECKKE